jgi:hypothetical protein
MSALGCCAHAICVVLCLVQVGQYLDNVLSQNSLCVAGINVDHAELTEVASSLFSSLPESRSHRRSAAEYTGGDFRTEADSHTTTVGLAFQDASWSSHDIVLVSLLQSLMGGGSAFSGSCLCHLTWSWNPHM